MVTKISYWAVVWFWRGGGSLLQLAMLGVSITYKKMYTPLVPEAAESMHAYSLPHQDL